MLVAQKSAAQEEPAVSDMHATGCIASILQLLKLPDNTVKVLVEGHCDERGTEEYNMALGEKRAKSVKDYLVSLGIAEDRISVVSYGKTRPIDPSGTEEAFNKNRRAESKVTAK